MNVFHAVPSSPNIIRLIPQYYSDDGTLTMITIILEEPVSSLTLGACARVTVVVLSVCVYYRATYLV